jgi:enoyl-CoA hydratase
MSEQVKVEIDGAVATVTVDNPPVNAMSDAVLEGLRAAAEAISADRAVRSVVLTGAGERAFIAGADLGEIAEHLGRPEGMRAHVEATAPMFEAWAQMPQPLVAAVQAHAVGGGLELALLCDLIVVAPNVKLGLPEVTLGLIPGAGGTQRLPRRVSSGTAAEMLLLGRLLDAEEALEAGLVNEVADESRCLERATALAARLSALPALAVQAAKRAMRGAMTDGAGIGAREVAGCGLALERQLFLSVAASSDALEGARAFLERRAPKFEHR